MDIGEYRAVQDAMALAHLMSKIFCSLQESANAVKNMAKKHMSKELTTIESIQEIKKDMAAIQAAIDDIHNTKEPTISNSDPTHMQSHQLSYAEMASWSHGPKLDPKHADTIAKAKIANQHVIIKPTSKAARIRMKITMEKQLVEQMNETLFIASTGESGTPGYTPKENRVVGA